MQFIQESVQTPSPIRQQRKKREKINFCLKHHENVKVKEEKLCWFMFGPFLVLSSEIMLMKARKGQKHAQRSLKSRKLETQKNAI